MVLIDNLKRNNSSLCAHILKTQPQSYSPIMHLLTFLLDTIIDEPLWVYKTLPSIDPAETQKGHPLPRGFPSCPIPLHKVQSWQSLNVLCDLAP